MRVAQRVEFSLAKTRVEKLIVCLGHNDGTSATATRGAVGAAVAQRLLQRCQPGPSDVHDADVTRADARDRRGQPRVFYAAQERQRRRGRHGRRETVRTPQTWDSCRVADFMGVWCDRLLLGDARHPSRAAVLEPRVPPLLWGEAVMRVAQAHRHLALQDVLVVQAEPTLAFGLARLHPTTPSPSASPSSALGGTVGMAEALQYFQRPQTGASYLLVGIGDEHGARTPLSVEEAALVDTRLLPLCAFAAALWTANPAKAAEYVAASTATPETLAATEANQRLWATMQHAMLSTRDTALLRAYFNDEVLDARFNPAQTRYFAESLLQRLREEELRS